MKKYDLLSISPLDGRYYQACKDMSLVFSEYNLIKSRIFVEVKWLIHLSNTGLVTREHFQKVGKANPMDFPI